MKYLSLLNAILVGGLSSFFVFFSQNNLNHFSNYFEHFSIWSPEIYVFIILIGIYLLFIIFGILSAFFKRFETKSFDVILLNLSFLSIIPLILFIIYPEFSPFVFPIIGSIFIFLLLIIYRKKENSLFYAVTELFLGWIGIFFALELVKLILINGFLTENLFGVLGVGIMFFSLILILFLFLISGKGSYSISFSAILIFILMFISEKSGRIWTDNFTIISIFLFVIILFLGTIFSFFERRKYFKENPKISELKGDEIIEEIKSETAILDKKQDEITQEFEKGQEEIKEDLVEGKEEFNQVFANTRNEFGEITEKVETEKNKIVKEVAINSFENAKNIGNSQSGEKIGINFPAENSTNNDSARGEEGQAKKIPEETTLNNWKNNLAKTKEEENNSKNKVRI